MARDKEHRAQGRELGTRPAPDQLSTDNRPRPTENRGLSTPKVIMPVVGPPVPRVPPGRQRARVEFLAARRAEASKPCCQNCVSSLRPAGKWLRIILSSWPGLLLCANCDRVPGTLMEVFRHHVCRNFRLRWLPPIREGPPDPPNGNFRYLTLTKGRQALVDPEDYERLKDYKWCTLVTHSGRAYAHTRIAGRMVYLHRVIMNAPPGKCVDHINGNGLDNRRCNLRLCNRTQNALNKRKCRGTSRFKGVWRCPPDRWLAAILFRGHKTYLGIFADEVEAARARDRWAFALQGRFAWLNFPADFRTKDPADAEFQALRRQARDQWKIWKAKQQKRKDKRARSPKGTKPRR